MSKTVPISLPFGYGVQRLRYINADSIPVNPISKKAYAVATAAALCVGALPQRAGSVSKHSVVRKGRRLFAVHELSLTDHIAAQTRKRGNWEKLPGTATRARVIRNFT